MRYLALAVDFDGTLAHDGIVGAEVIAALERLAATGRKLILVTGRELDQLLGIFPQIALFDRVVAENGALLYRPGSRERQLLTTGPTELFVAELRRRGVSPLSVGNSIVATVEPNEIIVLETIRDLGLELQVTFNKGAVMILPAGVTKASGLLTALVELNLSRHNVVAIGDGENDHALLETAEYSAAVANALPLLREKADRVTSRTHGEGVIELIDDLISTDLAAAPTRRPRTVVLGSDERGAEISVPAAGALLLIAGDNVVEKWALAAGILERLCVQGYQFCVIDSGGVYKELRGAVKFGDARRSPGASEVLTALEKPDVSTVVDLSALSADERPAFCTNLLGRLRELRARSGRPHWILVDEIRHLVPANSPGAAQDLDAMIYVTAKPDSVAPSTLRDITMAAMFGAAPANAIQALCQACEVPVPLSTRGGLARGQALWWTRDGHSLRVLNVASSQTAKVSAERAAHA